MRGDRLLLVFACLSSVLLGGAFASAQEVSGQFKEGSVLVGYDTATCDAARDGAMRFNSATDTWNFCNGTAWTALGGTPAGSDRQIQFNSGGVFFASSGLTYSSVGVLVVTGGNSNDYFSATGQGNRMVFVPGKSGAFRVGGVDNFDPTAWDWNNVGHTSIGMGWNAWATNYGSVAIGRLAKSYSSYAYALGDNATVNGQYSYAIGQGTTGNGDYSFAIGHNSIATGIDSLALGRDVTAGNGTAGNGLGDGSMALGLVDNAVTITTRPQVTGIQSLGIFMGDQDGGVVMSAANTMGLFGGKMVIDPRVPATNLVADTAFEVEGALKIAYDAQACAAASEGAFRYNSATDTFEVCQTAGSWTNMQAGTPVGAVVSYAGSSAPSGWLLCYGQAVSRATYAALFTAIGTTYGAGDGSTTFNLPDLRGRTVAGDDDMGGTAASRLTNSGTGNPGINGTTLGAAGGVDRHTLTTAQMPSHSHSISNVAPSGTGNAGSNNVIPANDAIDMMPLTPTIGSAGSGNAHPNVQPTIVLNYIIYAGS